jgi:polysaccharide pyruvyl transferase WcaK-like protein
MADREALLVNDTSSWYHFGCSCTSLAIHAELRARWPAVRALPIHRVVELTELPRTVPELDDDAVFERFGRAYPDVVDALTRAHTVYVNGEGTLHNVGQQALALLYLVYLAKTRLGRPVHLLNHSCFPDDSDRAGESPAFELYRKVYEVVDFVAVREGLSARLLADMGIRATQSFDCLPLFVERYFRPGPRAAGRTVVIAGSVAWGGANVIPALGEVIADLRAEGYTPVLLVGANAYLAHDDVLFAEALRRHVGDAVELCNATSELEWLGMLRNANLVVSGRFHHSIAAAFVDTPFIVMESNTPKIAGLVQLLESDAFVSVTGDDLGPRLRERAARLLADPEAALVPDDVKDRLRALARANFDGAPANLDRAPAPPSSSSPSSS